MLNRQQRFTLWQGWRSPNSPLSTLPRELAREISVYVGQDTIGFNEALKHAAHGRLKELKAKLDKASKENVAELTALLCFTGTAITSAGLTAQDSTLLECAMLSGDPELAAMIKPYFLMFEDGEAEMERQLARCRPCINAIMEQQPEDLTWLFDIIKQASIQDVAEELKTGNQYDKAYQSALRDALNQWRKTKLDSTNRVIDVAKAPRMHCHYQNWINVNKFLDECAKNKWKDLTSRNNYDKVYLIQRQLRGFIELTEFPACERFAVARNEVTDAPNQLNRSLNFIYAPGSFPDFDASCLDSHSGVGFDSCISICGKGLQRLPRWSIPGQDARDFSKLLSSKNNRLAELIQPRPKQEQTWCVIV